ncbi:NCAN-like protein [Mya arenaria]|uniref:NCAN-like protein n=1 Tax=Mya arenaria TaxID=6604 RepID=A0ABY7DBA0_MYAAR|nr:NCAN-like protein [Mya arenaria]
MIDTTLESFTSFWWTRFIVQLSIISYVKKMHVKMLALVFGLLFFSNVVSGPCDSNPCKFGTCTGNGSVIDDCAGVSCNSGTCVDTVNNYWCDCTGTSNSGRYCELRKLNERMKEEIGVVKQ